MVTVTDRILIEHLYKVFSDAPRPALQRLAAGASKEQVLAETGLVVGLNDVSLSVPAGAIYMVMGLSGSGKSTLARCINRLIEPTAGRILLDGDDIVAADDGRLRDLRRTRVSMVFQHFALLPHRTVLENVEFGLKLRGIAARPRRQKAEEILAVVGLARWGHHLPSALSGGMRQRVGLARALATDADVLIMDEAFSALDPLIRTEMQDELLRLQRTLHKTILFITHDFQEALKLGTRIAIMADGAVVREGTPQEIVTDPGSDYVAAFTREVDRSRLFDARSVMVDARPIVARADGTVELAGASGPGQSFVVDDAGRLIGTVAAADLPRLQQGIALRSLASADCATVPGHARLADIAGACSGSQPVAVIDEDGRLLGRVEPSRILARIAAPAAPLQP
ncbi:quaternary amine ABC transporter ATP-binding protein [Inquilinus sp. CA228]|uniref:quaternary amine ABC transporter ATP-binding protein n=1 Tax=Inquilinus sp. CA228 TaxID=3455609 RepID=UPI003F8D6F18